MAAAAARPGPSSRPHGTDDDDDDLNAGTVGGAPPMECHADATSRIVLIVTPKYMEHLAVADAVAADGCAWRAQQAVEYQWLYAVHVRVGRVYVQAAFCLLPDRTAHTYETAWNLLRGLCPGRRLEPRSAVLDVDSEARLGFARAFPDALITVGRAHLARAWHDRIVRLGMGDEYRAAVDALDAAPHQPPAPPPCRTVGEWLARFFGLPMLPPDLVDEAFRRLVDAAPPDPARLGQAVAAAAFAHHVRSFYMRDYGPCPPHLWARRPEDDGGDGGDGPTDYWRRVGQLFGGPELASLDQVAVTLLENQADSWAAMVEAARYGHWKKKLASHGTVVSRQNARAWRSLCENRLSLIDYLQVVASLHRE